MSNPDSERSPIDRATQSYVVVIVAALLVGAMLAPMAYGATSGPDGTVAVIHLEGSTTAPNVDAAVDALQEARANDSIDAVVLVMDSGGGPVGPSEELGLAVERTAEEMPVVATVQGLAASGGYMGVVGADHIYAQPSSQVGSVGVIAAPIGQDPGDQIVATGPNKLDGSTELEYRQHVGIMHTAFIDHVVENRDDDLELTEDELAYAKIYTGVESVENGMVDEIGGTEHAVAEAADRAGLDDYDTVEFESPDQLAGALLLEQDGEIVFNQQASAQLHPGVDRPVYLAIYGTPTSEITGVGTPDSAAAPADEVIADD